VAAVLAGCASLAWAQTTEVQPRIARLVKTLGHDSYQARRAADLELLQLGDEGLRQLNQAAQSPDLEVRLRALNLLERIAVMRLWEPTTISLSAREAKLTEILAQCGQQTGNHIFVGEPYGEFTNKPVTYHAGRKPYWHVLDDLARLTDNRVRVHFDTRMPGVVLISGDAGKFPTAYAGPIRAQITSARRAFTEDLDYDQAASEVSHSFQLNVQMLWEDRFRLVAYGCLPEVIEARTDTGVNVAAPHSSFGGWNVASPGTRQVSSELKLNPPPANATRFSVLRLKWSLIALGDLAIAELDHPSSGAALHADGLTAKVVTFDRQTPGRVELTLLISRDLAVPDPPEIMFQENGIELLDSQLRAFQLQSQQHSMTDRGVEFKLAFLADNPTAAPARLRIAYPKLRSRRDLEIVFRDVPLPSQKPK
jgi:hypothetical protein